MKRRTMRMEFDAYDLEEAEQLGNSLRMRVMGVILSLEHIQNRFERMDLEVDFDKFDYEVTEEIKTDRKNLIEVYKQMGGNIYD